MCASKSNQSEHVTISIQRKDLERQQTLQSSQSSIERLQCIILPSNGGLFGAQPPIAIIHFGHQVAKLLLCYDITCNRSIRVSNTIALTTITIMLDSAKPCRLWPSTHTDIKKVKCRQGHTTVFSGKKVRFRRQRAHTHTPPPPRVHTTQCGSAQAEMQKGHTTVFSLAKKGLGAHTRGIRE